MLFNNKKAISISGIDPASVMKGAGIIGKSTMPAAGTAASAAIGAAKGIGSGIFGGLGFGIGANLTTNLTAGFWVILFAFLANMMVINNLLQGKSVIMIHVVIALVLYLFIMKGDSLIFVMLALSLLPAFTSILPSSSITTFIANTFANPFLPWWFIYAGLFRNTQKGKLATAVFWFLVFVLMAVGYMYGGAEIARAANIEERLTPEQIQAYETGKTGVITAMGKLSSDIATNIQTIPQSIERFFNPKISAAGGDALFGTTKQEQPKLGIAIQNHPSGATRQGDTTIIKALLTLPNQPEDKNFLTITGIKCYHLQSRTDAEVDGRVLEYSPEELQKGVNLFYNRPLTVSCEFDSGDMEGISTVKIAVSYDFETNAKLITYIMKEDLLEELLIKEDPLDYMAVPSNRRNPATRYDNGPAKFGIGPIELMNPPLGVKGGKTYPAFELVIGNKPEFNGRIGKVNNIAITLPRGFSLTSMETCAFKALPDDTEKYLLNEAAVKAKPTDFTNIQSSRLFTCPMAIDTQAALGAASFEQVEFDVDADITYETEAELPTRARS